ncbi:MAG TPA: hypothetical protein VN345_01165, partial [Blastocatellia bacterium]|nr:hypothetical protein [Blastocatellia bacterium]
MKGSIGRGIRKSERNRQTRVGAILLLLVFALGSSSVTTRATLSQEKAGPKPELVPQVNSPGGSQIAISPDGRLLASSGRGDSAVGLWEIATGRELRTFSGSGAVIYAVGFSPDGKLIAAQTGDQTVEIWDVVSGRELNTLSIPDQSAGASPLAIALANRYAAVAFGPGGKMIAASNGRTVATWDVVSGSLMNSLSDDFGIQGFGLRPDGRELAVIVTEPAQLKLPKPQGGGRGQFGLPFPRIGGGGMPSGGVGLPAGLMPRQPALKIIDVETGKETRNDHLTDAIVPGATSSAAYRSSDGHLLVLGFNRQGSVRVWDATARHDLPALPARGQLGLSHALSPDGGLLAVCEIGFSSTSGTQSMTGSTRVLDTATGQELRVLAGASAVAFSPDGHVLATGDYNTIKVWDVAS